MPAIETKNLLRECVCKGNLIYLPSYQLDRAVYLKLKEQLEFIGGKWKGGKTGAFVFPEGKNTEALLFSLLLSESENQKKEFQFFETPPFLADEMLMYAKITGPELLILEPSAGRGNIVKSILKHVPNALVHGYELNPTNQIFLASFTDFVLMGSDFLNMPMEQKSIKYDRIIANPPFSKNQDIEHIYAMYDVLANNGIIVTICSTHYSFAQEKKAVNFKEWLLDIKANCIQLPKGTFLESGTNVPAVMLIIEKRNKNL